MNVRRPRLGELADVVALMRAADIADAGIAEWNEHDLRRYWDDLDLEQNAWIVEVDGRLAGYVDVETRGGGRTIADGYVHPELRGRGVGGELVRLAEGRALALVPEGRAYLQFGTLSRAEPFFAARGYEAVRTSLRMAIDLEEEPTVTVPAGIELRPLRHPEEDETAHEVLEGAFADHWEHRPRPFEEYARRTFHRDDFDATLCPVALAGDEMVGASLNWWKSEGDWGFVGVIGVRPAWRRRGAGEALLRWSFAEFFRRGERRVALGVDGLNESGAVRLYERLGMRRVWEAIVWEKELRRG